MALTDKLTAIADAIRSKTGTSESLTLDGMVTAIDGISVGSGDEASVVDSLIDGSITEITSNATKIGSYAFYDRTNLTTADIPLITSIGIYAFAGCTNLTTANFPLVTSIGMYAFNNCSSLTTVDFPLVTSIGDYAFYSCTNLTTANFPLVTSIGRYAFRYCNILTAVILRSETLCSLNNTNAFDSCYHILGKAHSTINPNGDKDGYIYVPSALLDSYKTATNWSTYASQFRALEDYTVDGTITGELDESKI